MALPNFKNDLATSLKKLAGVHAVGELWWHFDPNAKPAGVQLFAGQVLSRAAYEAHWNLVSTKRKVVSESEWQSYKTSWGFCPYYSSGDGSTTYRMPFVQNVHPKFVAAITEAGKYIEAGLPNITGMITRDTVSNTQPIIVPEDVNLSGSFYSTKLNKTGPSYGTTNYSTNLGFDASLSNPIYGNSDTVQPPAVNVIIGEYVVGSVAALGEADAESLLASVTTLEGNVGALENGVGRASAYITETWHEGTEWYRKWSDGWIEQGGYIATTSSVVNGKIVTFPIAFSDANYTLLGGVLTKATAENMAAANLSAGFSKTATSFSTDVTSQTYGQGKQWYACGY